MDELQRFLRARCADADRKVTNDWITQLSAMGDRDVHEELLVALHLAEREPFWWEALAEMARRQRSKDPPFRRVPSALVGWGLDVTAGTVARPVSSGAPRKFWRDVHVVAAVATYKRNGVTLERAFELVSEALTTGKVPLTSASVKTIWLDGRRFAEPEPGSLGAKLVQQLDDLLG